VWELDATLFRRHATPSIHGYAEETATVMRELDMARRRARLRRMRHAVDAAGTCRAAG
jgi:hypothetical protein